MYFLTSMRKSGPFKEWGLYTSSSAAKHPSAENRKKEVSNLLLFSSKIM